ncbi:SDR family NAD(P)-dependent oxidoreductase [Promicromonospora thailandica]|uniref:Short-chain dehydrogenase n=1 Tax=Promicromonospora thailandica TaxID=765201 RepID=A0A9X2G568_9MICO|nr:SDR family NAD(P)-dependent oxidoreductase [Promicromonospora thailandica]MCP2265527.1 Short-chain dehydrogenase [Promicromonospora thailandica]BFF17090.1 SDR family oxidoreductase [Promicromonospora thailandica]
MDLDLAGKRILVTGASRGIGLATTMAFLAEGASVVAVARRSTPALEATGAQFVSADLSTPDGPAQMVESVLATDPRLDVLVNNVGGGDLPDGVLTDPFGGDDADWLSTINLNLLAAVRVTRAAAPALVQARGAVVNVSSDSALTPHTAPLPYTTAKAALNAFSRGLAERLAPAGVRVNVVTPASTRTGMIEAEGGIVTALAAAHGVEHAEFLAGFPQFAGLITGQLVEPDEVARIIVLLASPTMPSAVGSNWALHAGTLKAPA